MDVDLNEENRELEKENTDLQEYIMLLTEDHDEREEQSTTQIAKLKKEVKELKEQANVRALTKGLLFIKKTQNISRIYKFIKSKTNCSPFRAKTPQMCLKLCQFQKILNN